MWVALLKKKYKHTQRKTAGHPDIYPGSDVILISYLKEMLNVNKNNPDNINIHTFLSLL